MTATTVMPFDNTNPFLKEVEARIMPPTFDKTSRRVSQETLETEEGSTHFDDSSQEDDFDLASSASCKSEEAELTVAQEEKKQEEETSSTSGVRFSTIEIRSYAMILGDNPSVTNGVPITLDWEHQDEIICDVTDYESARPARRARMELLLPPSIRAQIAMGAGSSRKELQSAQRKVNISRGQRRSTQEREKLYKIEEAMEKTWRILSRKGKKEKAFVQQALQTVTASTSN